MRYVLARDGSPVQVFELMAPLTNSPFAAEVVSGRKASPAAVVTQMLDLLEAEVHEMHVGDVERLYQTYLRSPQEALTQVNVMTGG